MIVGLLILFLFVSMTIGIMIIINIEVKNKYKNIQKKKFEDYEDNYWGGCDDRDYGGE